MSLSFGFYDLEKFLLLKLFQMKKSTIYWMVYILLVLILCWGVWIFLYWKYQNSPWELCKSAVLSELKAPKTAQFDDMPSYSTFPIYGVVHSQNSYGALVKNEFKCVEAYGLILVERL